MVNKKGVILVASKRMDENKKGDRIEGNLIRLSANARRTLGFIDGNVQLFSKAVGNIEPITLNIFHAFTADIKDLKKSGEYSTDDLKRICFVTTDNFRRLCTDGDNKDVWVSQGVEDTVVGTDPEFLLFDKDGQKIIHANNTRLNYTGLLGYDGAMAEIRPAPASCIEELVNNMTNIFADERLTAAIKDLKWTSGCYFKNNQRDFPIGGHIHIGNPAKIAAFTEQKRICLFVVMNKILDELLAIPMTKLDGPLGKTRRTGTRMARYGGYGFFGEWRMCNGRLEHRTLSGMWLTNPSLAKAVLGTAKAITDEIFKLVEESNYNYNYICPISVREQIKKSSPNSLTNNESVWKSNFDQWESIPLSRDLQCVKSSEEMRRILNESKAASINKPFLDKWLRTMKSLSTYKKYQKYIDGLYEILLVPVKEMSAIDNNIQKNWLEGNQFPVNL